MRVEKPQTADTISEETEFDRIVSWRTDELIRAGFEPCDAMILAHSIYVDLHYAIGLVENGCPIDLALRILI